jgi:hypothetical protein
MNRKMSMFFVAAGLCASARRSHAWRDPAAVSHAQGRLTLYAVADNGGSISKKEWNGTLWTSWSQVFASPPGFIATIAVEDHIGSTDDYIAIKGTNGNLYVNLPDFSGPVPPTNPPPPPPPPCPNCLTASTYYMAPSLISAGPAAVSLPRPTWDTEWLWVFFVDTAGVLKSQTFSDHWHEVTIPNAPTGLTELGATRIGTSSMMVCGKKGTSYLCSPTIENQAAWPSGAWTTLPGTYSSRPAVATWVTHLPRVFGISSFDTQVWHTTTLFGWEAPIAQGGDLGSAPTVANWDSQTTHVFAKAHWDNNIWYTYQVGTAWASSWFPVD